MGYLRQENLTKLHEYKYSGVDKSLVSRYVLKPFYTNVAIHFFPMSMAPNLITLTGFVFVCLNILQLLYYTPGLDEECPRYVYACWSVGLFLYQTFDAIDGTQARRTKQSGPLGELFDHGVDACNTTLEVLLFCAAMKMGQGWRTILILFASLFTFYTQTWDEYHTKTLTLGLISGPVEGVLTMCIVYALTAMHGPDLWSQSMLATLGVSSDLLPQQVYELTFIEVFMIYGGLILLFNTVVSAMSAVKARDKERYPNPVQVLAQLFPFLIQWPFIVGFLYEKPLILHEHLLPFVAYLGLVNAYGVGRVIVAHLVKSEFPWDNILLAPLIIAFFDAVGPSLQEHLGFGWPSVLNGDETKQVAFVWACLGLGLGVYGSFVADVIRSICDYLDIWCLTIKHPANEQKESEKKAQ